MRPLDRAIAEMPPWQAAGLCLGLTAVIGAGDVYIAVERFVALLYLFPVALGAWLVGRSFGLVLAVIAALTSFAADLPAALLANHVGAFGIFATVALLVSRLEEREAAERAARHLMEGIVDAVPARVFWKDKNLVYLGCNEAFALDAGFSDPKNVVGKDDYQMAWRDQAESYRADDRQVIESARAKLLIEEPQTTPEGDSVTLLTSKVPLRGPRGEVGGVLGTYLRVSELERAEESLRASEIRYRRLFESAKDGILILDAETGTVMDVNPFLIELLGSSREALLGEAIWELGFFKDIVASRERLAELLRKGYVRYDDTALQASDGRRIDVEFVSSAYRVNQEKVIQCNIRDITRRKHAEAFLQAVVDEIPAVVFARDLQGRFTLVNRAWEAMTGTSREAAIGRTTHSLYDAEIADVLREADQHALASADGVPLVRESTVTTGGELRTLLTTRAPLRGPGGRTDGIVGVSIDITERKRAEADRLRLSQAVEQAAEAIMITDAGGTILYTNPAFERTTGYTCEEAVGQNPRILKSGTQHAEFYRQMWIVLSRGDVWHGRLVNRRKDGTLFEEDATISPVRDGAGKIVNYVAVKRDISKESLLEQQLFRAQKMEAIGSLAGGIAHDFNNLLGVIMGCGQIVHRQLAGQDPRRRQVEQILKAAERAAGLTRQLLAFSRQQVLQPKILDLNAVVADIDQMLRRLIGEDIELTTLLAPHLGSVRADRGQIEQVIMNLAVNARDAMPDGGRLTIETRNSDLDGDYAAAHVPARAGRYVTLVLTDTGSGMTPATQARIFEPFFSTKDVGKGTGLGLSTVYGIVKQSDGYIWVYSEVGVGTTFKIYLPRIDEEAAMERQQQPGPLLGGSETVLLVEDEASLRELLCETLEANGYSVLVARDGAEALQVAESHAGTIEIMVTDVIMPGMTGPKLVDLLAPTRPGMKVLFVSGYSDESVMRHGLVGPRKTFLSKPFGSEVLLRTVRQSLDAD